MKKANGSRTYDVILKGWVLADHLIFIKCVVDQCTDRRRAAKRARILNEELRRQCAEETLSHLRARVA